MSRPSRKRTRSVKGQIYDEMLGKSPKEKNKKKKVSDSNLGETSVKRRIVFNDDNEEQVRNHSNNASYVKKSKPNWNKLRKREL